MKKLLIIALTILTIPAFAVGPAPEALKGGVITVTLKDGKVYTFSSDEYAVVKRGVEGNTVSEAELKQTAKNAFEAGKMVSEGKTRSTQVNKNIISVGVVRSQNGLDYTHDATTHVISTQYEIGASLMYQRNFFKDLYLGGRVDTNSGAEVNLGLGF